VIWLGIGCASGSAPQALGTTPAPNILYSPDACSLLLAMLSAFSSARKGWSWRWCRIRLAGQTPQIHHLISNGAGRDPWTDPRLRMFSSARSFACCIARTGRRHWARRGWRTSSVSYVRTGSHRNRERRFGVLEASRASACPHASVCGGCGPPDRLPIAYRGRPPAITADARGDQGCCAVQAGSGCAPDVSCAARRIIQGDARCCRIRAKARDGSRGPAPAILQRRRERDPILFARAARHFNPARRDRDSHYDVAFL